MSRSAPHVEVQRPITPTTGMWEQFDADMRAYMTEIAGNVRLLLGRQRADEALDELESYRLEPEALAALWTLFNSGERTVLKAVLTARRAKEEL
jgi:hypothetical protein